MKSEDKLKVLFLGHCSYFHVQNIAALLKESQMSLHIAGANMIRPDGKEVTDSDLGSFDEFISIPRKRNVSLNTSNVMKEFFRTLSGSGLQKELFRNLIKLRLGNASKLLMAAAEERKYSAMVEELFSKYDVFHFHFIVKELLTPLKYVGSDKIVVLHVWGSDLLNRGGIQSYSAQYEAIKRADFIIINTIEMTQYFLAKFGREFAGKIRNAYFVIDNEMMKRISEADTVTLRKKFTGRYGIDESKIILEAGYNASKFQKHLELIEQLNLLNKELKEKIHVVIPMTYGLGTNADDYLNAVKRAAAESSFSTTVIDSYITPEEVLELIVSTEIKLNLRETDNLNTAMIESFCSDTITVNGAWMPYGTLRRLGVYYREIESICHLKNELEYILHNIDSERAKTKDNSKKVREYFDDSRVVLDWIRVYKEIDSLSKLKRGYSETA